jgi:hypothetical protein
MNKPFYFCRRCWRDERRAGASLRIAWQVARDGSTIRNLESHWRRRKTERRK